MKVGDTIKAIVHAVERELVLEDRVYPDRSCGQYDAGFWAYYKGTENDDDEPDFFVNESGEVFGNTDQYPDSYDFQVGKVISNATADC